MLDHPQNDIFIHMDAKNKLYNPSDTLKLVKFSNIYHTRRIKVAWGGYSQIEAELILLEASTENGSYEHYHLLSGADLPIKKQEDIIAFFEEHHGLEFVSFQSDVFPADHEIRVRFYHPLQEYVGRDRKFFTRVRNFSIKKLNGACIIFQKIMRKKRNMGINFQKGSNWFSITDELARYVLTQKDWIRKVFCYTFCCDEVFLHTIVRASDFCNRLFRNSARFIDWKRGGPYVFTIDDLEAIKQSEAMFARKFDETKDAEIIREIQKLYS